MLINDFYESYKNMVGMKLASENNEKPWKTRAFLLVFKSFS